MNDKQETSPHLRGVNEPVDAEIEAFDLEVTGSIPPELEGTLVRIAVNPLPPFHKDHNAFFGEGMVHALTFKGGKAQVYRNRWVRTPAVSKKLGEEPLFDETSGVDLANTHVIPFAGALLAMTETCLPYRLGESLETQARDDLGGLDGGFTAHPHVDPRTQLMHALGYDLNSDASTTHYVFSSDGRLVGKNTLALGGPSWLHDMATTENHMVLWDLPVLFDQALFEASATSFFRWNPNYQARVGLRRLDADNDSVRWFDIDPGWVFHPVNAWEETNQAGVLQRVICDVCRYDKAFDSVLTAPMEAPPQIWRWTIDVERGLVSSEIVDDRAQEFPRIDDRFWGVKHDFSVTTQLVNRETGGGLIVTDSDGRSNSFLFDHKTLASEGIFVPASSTAGEGEGWILCGATNLVNRATKTCVFDATRIQDGPIAEVAMPQRIPGSFHGSWVPEQHGA